MIARFNCKDLFIVSAACEELVSGEVRDVRVIVDSLEIDVHTFVEVLGETFPDKNVSFPRIGRAAVVSSVPAWVSINDFLAVLAWEIHQKLPSNIQLPV